MKTVKLNQLTIGDVFAYELKLKGREAFEVVKINTDKDSLSIQSRSKKKGG